MTRYLLDNDDDGHWYLVPESDKDAFGAWVYEEGEEPSSVVRLSGHPNNVTFEVPLQFGEPMAAEGADLEEIDIPTIQPNDLKMTREALCAAQSALAERARSGLDVDRVSTWSRRIQLIIDQIDIARPLGPDGTHGERHTPTCGCEDQ